MLRSVLKDAILRTHAGDYLYGQAQEAWFEREYRQRRERYWLAVAADPAAERPEAHLARARRKIAQRGYTVVPRREGEIHTYAYVPANWPHQSQIASALARLGPVTRFDYVARNITLEALRTGDPANHATHRRLFDELLADVLRAHRERPIDWFFSYATGYDMAAEVARRIQEEIGVPTVNISLDDKNWWDTIERRAPTSGMKYFAPSYDLGWTSASSVLSWYWAEGGQAMFLPEGVDTEWFAPMDVAQDIDVGFVGSCFGYRPRIIEALRKAGITVQVHGQAWPFSSSMLGDREMRVFFNRCRINLGLGDMHYSRWMTNLKGRDFEVPATGRGLYLTTYNADLATCFHIGSEIACYRGLDEMIELIRHYLDNPEEAAEMARRARERCLAEHQWIHRYRRILIALGVLNAHSLPL
jgi:spore maturation protein CgeB